MSHEEIIRTVAVVAAVALLAAPYRQQLAQYAAQAAEAAKQHGATIGRIAAALLIVAAAWGKIPLPSLPSAPAIPAVTIETPSSAMQSTVRPIADVLKAAPIGDRMLWANLWSKAATVVAGDELGTEVVITDTRALRMFTTLALPPVAPPLLAPRLRWALSSRPTSITTPPTAATRPTRPCLRWAVLTEPCVPSPRPS